VYAAWVTLGWDSAHTVRIVDDLGLVVFSIFATTCSLLAALSARERQRVAWICLTIGMGG
jgi:hypothetical protein